MTDRDFWMAIRSALLLLVSAIERRWKLGKYSTGEIVIISERDSVT